MRYVKIFGAIVGAAIAMMAFAGGAGATVVTWASGFYYTSTIQATAGTTELHGEVFSVNCRTSQVTGTVKNHGPVITATGEVSTLDFNECSFPVTVLTAGSLEAHATNGGNGTLTSIGAEITIHGPFGINCLYKTFFTDIGIITGSPTTKATAKLDINSALIPRAGDSAFCGPEAEWTGSYTITSPDSLSLD